jgi:hypothetical protein
MERQRICEELNGICWYNHDRPGQAAVQKRIVCQ